MERILLMGSSASFAELFKKITNLLKEHQEEYKITEEELVCLELFISRLRESFLKRLR